MEKITPMQADHPDEILDLVDEQDKIIGSRTRREIYSHGLRNFRVIHAFIVNDQGQLWIPRRSLAKKLYPGGLDFSIAGHVASGETYEQCLIREAQEEVGLDLTTTPFTEIGHFNPYIHDVRCFQHVYEINANEVPDYNRDDFSGFEWLTPQEVVNRYSNGDTGKDDIPLVIKTCYLS